MPRMAYTIPTLTNRRKKMLTNQIKKGTRVQMRNGWYGTMADNMRGNTRMVEVEGIYTETGSVYSHDIVQVEVGDAWQQVEHTPAQLKLMQMVW
jgi:hypothetical protein